MVKCVGHFCTQKRGATWTKKTDEIDAKLHSGPSNHAEQLAYRQMDSIDQGQWIYAFVQNDFPCEPCRVYFETQSSKNRRFIFIIVDTTDYYREWGFETKPLMPQMVYMAGGKSKIPGYVKVRTGGYAVAGDWSSWTDSLTVTRQLVAINETPTRPRQGQIAVGPKRPKWFPEHPSIDALLTYRFY